MLKPMYNFVETAGEKFFRLVGEGALDDFFKGIFKVTKRSKRAKCYCVENGPFHKYIKKLRRQNRR